MSDEYPWRLHGCPWSSVVVCPCIRSASNRWVECPMMVGSYNEQQEAIGRLRAKEVAIPMTRYRKKPVEVDAWQVGSDEPMPWWMREELGTINGLIVVMDGGKGFAVFDTAVYKDWMPAFKGDYVVRENTRFYACQKERFEQTYEAVNDAED